MARHLIACISSFRVAAGKTRPGAAATLFRHTRSGIILVCFLALSTGLRAQLVYQDDFNYSGALSSNGWVPFSNTGNTPINSGAAGLSYAGYANSGVGSAITINTSANSEGDEHVAA